MDFSLKQVSIEQEGLDVPDDITFDVKIHCGSGEFQALIRDLSANGDDAGIFDVICRVTLVCVAGAKDSVTFSINTEKLKGSVILKPKSSVDKVCCCCCCCCCV